MHRLYLESVVSRLDWKGCANTGALFCHFVGLLPESEPSKYSLGKSGWLMVWLQLIDGFSGAPTAPVNRPVQMGIIIGGLGKQ